MRMNVARLSRPLGEVMFGIESDQPVGSTCEQYENGMLVRDFCLCGRGYIEYEYLNDGVRVSKHSVSLDSVGLDGQLERAACCKQCADEDKARLERELSQ